MMRLKKMYVSVATTLALISFMSGQVLAVGSGAYENQVPSARAMGRANAMTASVDDATAVTFNSARLPEVPATNLSVGVALQDINMDYEARDGSTDEADNGNAYTPNFHVSSKFNTEKWGFGLGINVPQGLATNWTKSSPLRFIATKSELSAFNINPSVGYKITESLSVGAGLDYYWVNNVSLKTQVDVSALNYDIDRSMDPGAAYTAVPEGEQQLEGNGSDMGFDLGLAYNINKKHLFGVNYRHGAAVEVEGDVSLTNLSNTSAAVFGGPDYKTTGKTKVILPSQLMLGYGFKASDKWIIEFDTEWVEWSKFQDQNVSYAETDATRLSILNSGNPTPKNWKDVWSFALGTEYAVNTKWALRGGFSYYNTPVPETTFEAAMPDANVYILSLGTGYNVTEDLAVDLAAQLFKTENRSISNDIGSPTTTGNGKYQSTGGYYGLNFRYTFGKKS
jgi:long-chain fatty acid transport protein